MTAEEMKAKIVALVDELRNFPDRVSHNHYYDPEFDEGVKACAEEVLELIKEIEI